ncbi:MAG: methyltransferase family protein [Candidatus Brocadiales bacterium]
MGSTRVRLAWIPIVPITVGLILPYLATYLDATLPEVLLGSARWAGIPLFLGGIMLATSCARLIYSQEQWEKTATPTGTPRQLIVSGPYCYVRNPMLLGMLSIICGEGLYLQSAGIFSYLGAFFVFINFVQVPGEERRLEEHFGEPYLRYKSKIRRWLPTTSPYNDNK